MDVYPDAKIILTTRDPESWVPSMQRSLYAILRMKRLKLLALFDWVRTHTYIPTTDHPSRLQHNNTCIRADAS